MAATVSLVQHEDMLVDRMELLYATKYEALAQTVVRDIAGISPQTTVNLVPMDVADPWDFGEMYAALYDWVRGYRFDPAREQYWAHITTGTHVAQICMFLMVESRFIPGVLLQTAPPRKQESGHPGSYALIDLDLSATTRWPSASARPRRMHGNSSRAVSPRAMRASTPSSTKSNAWPCDRRRPSCSRAPRAPANRTWPGACSNSRNPATRCRASSWK